jgi:hypothetical protein
MMTGDSRSTGAAHDWNGDDDWKSTIAEDVALKMTFTDRGSAI